MSLYVATDVLYLTKHPALRIHKVAGGSTMSLLALPPFAFWILNYWHSYIYKLCERMGPISPWIHQVAAVGTRNYMLRSNWHQTKCYATQGYSMTTDGKLPSKPADCKLISVTDGSLTEPDSSIQNQYVCVSLMEDDLQGDARTSDSYLPKETEWVSQGFTPAPPFSLYASSCWRVFITRVFSTFKGKDFCVEVLWLPLGGTNADGESFQKTWLRLDPSPAQASKPEGDAFLETKGWHLLLLTANLGHHFFHRLKARWTSQDAWQPLVPCCSGF